MQDQACLQVLPVSFDRIRRSQRVLTQSLQNVLKLSQAHHRCRSFQNNNLCVLACFRIPGEAKLTIRHKIEYSGLAKQAPLCLPEEAHYRWLDRTRLSASVPQDSPHVSLSWYGFRLPLCPEKYPHDRRRSSGQLGVCRHCTTWRGGSRCRPALFHSRIQSTPYSWRASSLGPALSAPTKEAHAPYFPANARRDPRDLRPNEWCRLVSP